MSLWCSVDVIALMMKGPSGDGGGGLLKSMIDMGSGMARALTERGRTVVERPRAGDGDRERWLSVVRVRCEWELSDVREDVDVGGVPERLSGGDVKRRESKREGRGGGAAWL